MPKGKHGQFVKRPIWAAGNGSAEVYARVYDDGHIEIVGRNTTLDMKRGAYGKGTTQRWAYGENWRVQPLPWEASAEDLTGKLFDPGEED